MTTVRSGDKQINWNLHGADRIAQNVRNLINTYRYEIPYHRTMGLPGELIDRPSNALMEEARVEASRMLSIYEPRANVRDVQCSLSAAGNIEVEVILE
jgi:phage baseplate assembly protein W